MAGNSIPQGDKTPCECKALHVRGPDGDKEVFCPDCGKVYRASVDHGNAYALPAEALSSKDSLPFRWERDGLPGKWRLTTSDMGDGLVAGYDHIAGYYEGRLIDEVERLRASVKALLATCADCRGAGHFESWTGCWTLENGTRVRAGSGPAPLGAVASYATYPCVKCEDWRIALGIPLFTRQSSETGAKFANVSCSQCGRDFGPGEHGFSHCKDHP